MKRILFSLSFVSCCIGTQVYAIDFGEVAENLMTPTMVVTKIIIFACYLVGAILLFAAIAQYRIHRQSPKLVPLTTPVILVILGACLILIPYFTTLSQETGSAVEQRKKEGKDKSPPSRLIRPSSHQQEIGPGRLPPDEPKQPYEDPKKGSGHWSDKYK